MQLRDSDIANWQVEYDELFPFFEKLGVNICGALKSFLDDANIDFLDISYRIKSFESFIDKLERKKYNSPFKQIDDICGVRIIVFFYSDIDRVSKIIEKEFDIFEDLDKADELQPSQFGYRSHHFIVSIKEEWMKAPNYRDLEDKRAEIQLRTNLMHAWANLSHKIYYKNEEYVPYQFQRQVFQLSALFELADEKLDSLINEHSELASSNVTVEKKHEDIQKIKVLNVTSLQAVLDKLFADRMKDLNATGMLVRDLIKHNITIANFLERYNSVINKFNSIEKLAFLYRPGKKWSQVGASRAILNVTCDEYWEESKRTLPDHIISAFNDIRNDYF